MAYDIVIDAEAISQLRSFSTRNRQILRSEVDLHLKHEPKKCSASRIKLMRQPAVSEYRLRVGEFRVYYNVSDDLNRVTVVQVYEKGRRTTPTGDSDEDH